MIRINLLGQAKPKASRRQVDTGAALPVLFIGAGLLFGALYSAISYYWQRQLTEENANQAVAGAENRPGAGQASGRTFEKQKAVLQQRVSRRATAARSYGRSGTAGPNRQHRFAHRKSVADLDGQERQQPGPGGLSASINGVANFVTALKRSGYF